jgi:diguanylate cyclase (GGDEF)-like protein
MSRSAAKKAPVAKLPPEIHADLVETLFGTVGSFVSGLIGGLIVPVIAWFRTYDPIFLVCTGVIVLLAVFRVLVLLRHNLEDEQTRRGRARHWERLYAIGGIGFMTAVGLTAAIMLARRHDELTALYGIVIMIGCAGALAARNAGRPVVVLGQVLGVCGPVALVFLFQYDAWYWGLAFILVLVMSSVKSTTKFLNGMLVSALLNGREARIQRARLSIALDSMSHGLCMADRDGVVSVVNHRLQDFFRLEGDLVGLSVRELAERIAGFGEFPPAEAAEFVQALESHASKRDSCVLSRTVSDRIYDFRCEPMENGGVVVVVVEDVTETRLAAREVEHLAHFDSLTGLPNRVQFYNRMRAVLEHIAGTDEKIAILSIDLDQFKEVNDTLGHPMGDKLLRLVAERLRHAIRDGDLVARFGGDEFEILLQPSLELPDLEALGQRLIEIISAYYLIDGHTIRIGASIGIALAPEDAAQADDLVKCADLALYHAKGAGRGMARRFTPAMDAAMRRKREIEQELRDALANEHLEVHYQPVVDVRTFQIVGCEALVRWRHPVKGLVSPGEFIPVAEDTGLIVPIGEWVLRRACQDALSWPEHIRLAVNFSAKQFVLGKNLAETVKEIVASVGLKPSRLEVEITESTLMEAEEAHLQLNELCEAGFRVSLDDFGTGYSSLSYLREFPVDKIKIDRSFVQNLADPASHAVIGAVAFLSRALDVELVIEGVETEEQLGALGRWNINFVQGFLFSRPRPLAELQPLLDKPLSPSQARLKVA